MLRGLVLLLAVANLAYALWSHSADGAASADGDASQREPARLQQQIHPELIRVIAAGTAPSAAGSEAASGPQGGASDTASETAHDPAGVLANAPTGAPMGAPADRSTAIPASAAPAAVAASAGLPAASTAAAAPSSAAAGPSPPRDTALAGGTCVETGPFTEAEIGAVTQALQRAGVPAGAWVDMRRDQPGLWIVYMGRYVDAATLQRKRDELRRRGVAFQDLQDAPALEPGLSLGEFPSHAAAQARLSALERSGVHTARVVTLKAPGSAHRLRVDALDDARRQQLRQVPPGLLRAGWSRCDSSADSALH